MNEDVPPVVRELVGEDPTRLGVVVQAYQYLWKLAVCHEDSGLADEFDRWLRGKEWLEKPREVGGQTPLGKLRKVIEQEKQQLLSRGLDPCTDRSFN